MADDRPNEHAHGGPGDSSRVTTFQLYQAITELEKSNEARYSELRGELRYLRQALEGKGGVNDVLTDHEERLRPVERWKSALPVSTLMFMATTAVALVGLFLR